MGDKQLRLDKILVHMGYGSRKEIKKMVKQGLVKVNGQIVNDSGLHVDPLTATLEVNGQIVTYRAFVYLMLNKPGGVVSATEDRKYQTVIDLLPDSYRGFNLFPVGRLDIDTEGLLLLTNDGVLAHALLAPKKKIPKKYFARVAGEVGANDIQAFQEGVVLDDGYRTLPAELTIIESGPVSQIELTIYEGKFHQVKRMFQSVGKQVIYLKRVMMGNLELDDSLSLGDFRELSDSEVNSLKALVNL